MSQIFEKPVKEMIEHMVARDIAMRCVVGNQCRCSESDLLTLAGQVFVFDADCPCGEPRDETWPFRIVGKGTLATQAPAKLEPKRKREPPSAGSKAFERDLRKQLRHMSPVVKEQGSAMVFYVGRTAGRPGDAMLRIVCAAFERPERAGVVEVTILSVERVSGGSE